MKNMKTIIAFIKKIFSEEKYPRKCQNNQHYRQVITPTLSRTVISVDAPCQCGYYQGHNDFMTKQTQKRDEVLKKIQENK